MHSHRATQPCHHVAYILYTIYPRLSRDFPHRQRKVRKFRKFSNSTSIFGHFLIYYRKRWDVLDKIVLVFRYGIRNVRTIRSWLAQMTFPGGGGGPLAVEEAKRSSDEINIIFTVFSPQSVEDAIGIFWRKLRFLRTPFPAGEGSYARTVTLSVNRKHVQTFQLTALPSPGKAWTRNHRRIRQPWTFHAWMCIDCSHYFPFVISLYHIHSRLSTVLLSLLHYFSRFKSISNKF